MKLLILRAQVPSVWGSCRVISPNLSAAYDGLPADFVREDFLLHENFFSEASFTAPGGLFALAERIGKGDVDALVLLDHLPVQPEVCTLLSQVIAPERLPPLVFHLYGDFTYFASEWARFGKQFQGHRVRFIAASHRQAQLVENCIGRPHHVPRLFFPVDTERFRFSDERRAEARRALGFTNDDLLTIYTGRVSLQKNVDVALGAVDALGNLSPRHHFFVAGGFDDVGAGFASIDTFDGYMFAKMQRKLEACRFVRPRLLGALQLPALIDLLHAADIYISLSLYHDEDFGMAPAEALATGLPCVLSDWGGYASFPGEDYYAGMVPVRLDKFGLSLELAQMPPMFAHCQRISRTGRAQRAQAFAREFSIQALVAPLAEVLRTPPESFPGFSWRVQSLAQQFKRNGGLPAGELNPHLLPGAGGLYEEIYRSYLTPLPGADL